MTASVGHPPIRPLRLLITTLLLVMVIMLVASAVFTVPRLAIGAVLLAVTTAALAMTIQTRVRMPVGRPTPAIDGPAMPSGDASGPVETALQAPMEPVTVTEALPIANYDELLTAEALPELEKLDASERARIREHENGDRGRQTILDRLDQLDHDEARAPTFLTPDVIADEPAVTPATAVTSAKAGTPKPRENDDPDRANDPPAKARPREVRMEPAAQTELPQDPGPSDEPFPLDGYDNTSVKSLLPRLAKLTPLQLEVVAVYERQHANRKSVLRRIDKLLLTGGQ